MSDPVVDALHLRVLKMNGAQRPFALPILRALHRLGGSAKKSAVIAELHSLLDSHMPPGSVDELNRRGRFGWTRVEMKHLDLIGGADGTWALTDLGLRYVLEHKDDPFVPPQISFAARVDSSNEPGKKQTRTVPVTGFRAYEVPLLEALEAGRTTTKDIVDAVGVALAGKLVPGDFAAMPGGSMVWQFRTRWGLSSLGKAGDAVNVQSGVWKLTDSGRQRLQRERPAWDFTDFPAASATIVVDVDGTVASPAAPKLTVPAPKPVATAEERWARLRATLSDELVDVLAHRLRPDLGPTPAIGAFARNIILYGPPGTGKTHVAKLVARALTGDDDADGEGRSQLVQFHPSYAYEDFVQGLRPDVTKTELLYALKRGPFLRIVEAADNDAEHFHVLVIDEINRGDPARIFGELLYALEYRDEAVTLSAGGELSVPSNLVIIGTMNSVDRSVALVDYALRRRFGFVRLDPEASVIEQVHGDTLLGNAGGMVLDRFNDWLTLRLSRDHAIGHSYFLSASLDTSSAKSFDRLWDLDVKPLLEEYFFGDKDALQEAESRWRAIVAEAISEASDGDDLP